MSSRVTEAKMNRRQTAREVASRLFFALALVGGIAMSAVLMGSPPASAADAQVSANDSSIEEDGTSPEDTQDAGVVPSARQRRKALLQQRRQARRDDRREYLERVRSEKAAPNRPGPTAMSIPVGSAADIKVAFKLDPRLTRSLYMGDRWVSPPTYSGLQEGEFTVEARAHGHDGGGRPVAATVNWRPADRQIVSVSPGQGNAVTITVHRAGESRLRLTIESDAKEVLVSKELSIKAWYRGTAIQAEIDTSRPAVRDTAHPGSSRGTVRNGWRFVDEEPSAAPPAPSRPIVRNGWRVVE
jgi:hypothetical protein